MKQLNKFDIENLSTGSALLGSGGGGDPYICKLMLDNLIDEGNTINLASIDELDDDQYVVGVAFVGAPTVLREKLPAKEVTTNAIKHLEKEIGKEISAIIPCELGGMNGLYPFYVASRLGVPVIDVDGVGRALPELQMTTYNIYGGYNNPAVITNEHGETITLSAANVLSLEKKVRVLTIDMGGIAFVAMYLMPISQLKQVGILSAVSCALDIGKHLNNQNSLHQNPIQALCDELLTTHYGKGKEVFQGKITDIKQTSDTGFTQGSLIVESPTQSHPLTISYQNEFLIATQDSKVIASVPDLICVLDAETLKPIACDALRYGQQVKILSIRAPEKLRTDQALELVGPQVFGYLHDYEPI